MKYSIKKGKDTANITIEFDKTDFEKADKITERYFSQTLKISGFRKGNIPKSAIIKKIGETVYASEIKNILLNLAYTEIIKIENIKPLLEPTIKNSSDEFTNIEMEINLFPEINLEFLDKMSIERKDVKVSDNDVDKTLKEITTQNPKYKEVSRAAKKGDKVEIDFEGFDKNNNSLKGASSKNHPIVIGMNTFIPGFEDNLISMKKGDNKEFNLKFPSDYGNKELASSEVKFVVTIKRVEEPIEIVMDDTFAKEVSQGTAKNMKELKNLINLRLLEKKRYEEEQEFQARIVDSFYKKLTYKLPDKFIEDEFTHMKSSLVSDVQNKGYSMKQYYDARKTNEKKLDIELKEQALKRLKINLALRKIVESQNINLTSKEEEEIKANLKKDKNIEQAKSEKIFQKALSYLFTKCDVKKT